MAIIKPDFRNPSQEGHTLIHHFGAWPLAIDFHWLRNHALPTMFVCNTISFFKLYAIFSRTL